MRIFKRFVRKRRDSAENLLEAILPRLEHNIEYTVHNGFFKTLQTDKLENILQSPIIILIHTQGWSKLTVKQHFNITVLRPPCNKTLPSIVLYSLPVSYQHE